MAFDKPFSAEVHLRVSWLLRDEATGLDEVLIRSGNHIPSKDVGQAGNLARLPFTVEDVTDPIEVGSDATYVIRVANHGPKTGTNVRLAVALPAGMEPIGAEGPTRDVVTGRFVVFEPVPRLVPKARAVFRVSARGLTEGDQLIRVLLMSDDLVAPVIREERTRVLRR